MDSNLEAYARIIRERGRRCEITGHMPVYDKYVVNSQSRAADQVRGQCWNCFKVVCRTLTPDEIDMILERDRIN